MDRDLRGLIRGRLAQRLIPAERCRATTVVPTGHFVCTICDGPDRGRHIRGHLDSGAVIVMHDECLWEWERLLSPSPER